MTGLAITGAGGVLGVKLVEQALGAGDGPIHAFTHTERKPMSLASTDPRVIWSALDMGDAAAVAAAMREAAPDVIINSAAMTNVDACEDERDAAYAANALGPRHLAEVSLRLNARLIHVSTDYVFPGDAAHPGPYLEDAPTRAVNHYGWTKLVGERAVREVCEGRTPWTVVRTALVYGYVPGGRPNFVRWLAGELENGRVVRVVDDQFNTPTLADDLASLLLHLAANHVTGIIHGAGPDRVSRIEWARAIAIAYQLDERLIQVISTPELQQKAQRPLLSGLRSSRTDELAGVTMRGIRAGLERSRGE